MARSKSRWIPVTERYPYTSLIEHVCGICQGQGWKRDWIGMARWVDGNWLILQGGEVPAGALIQITHWAPPDMSGLIDEEGNWLL